MKFKRKHDIEPDVVVEAWPIPDIIEMHWANTMSDLPEAVGNAERDGKFVVASVDEPTKCIRLPGDPETWYFGWLICEGESWSVLSVWDFWGNYEEAA